MSVLWEDGVRAVLRYLASDRPYPFFVDIDSAWDAQRLIQQLPGRMEPHNIGEFCAKDSFPDYDRLMDTLEETSSDILLTGIGDAVALSGDDSIFERLKDRAYAHKTVVLCRNAHTSLERCRRQDPKFTPDRWCSIASETDTLVIRVGASVRAEAEDGLQALFYKLSSLQPGKYYVRSSVELVGVPFLSNAYAQLRELDPGFSIPEEALSPEQWEEYFSSPGTTEKDPFHFRSYLRYRMEGAPGNYLRLVVAQTSNYSDYRQSLLTALLRIKHTQESFPALYRERKELLKSRTDIGLELEEYLNLSRERDQERIYYLTDNTLHERRAILYEIAHIKRIPPELPEIYPALADYLNEYIFSGKNAALLTSYFEQYKRQKLIHQVELSFLERVNQLSRPGNRQYTALQHRNELILSVPKERTGLYWIDALCGEYLGFLIRQAKRLDLRIRIQIGRATLPTLTALNRNFYDDWKGVKFEKESRIDDLKHGKIPLPKEVRKSALHLADELDVLSECLNTIRTALAGQEVDRILLTTDHGASRLCVIHEKENRWEMAEKGIHSGRCCPKHEIDTCPESATDEYGFWVLANYDLFKGGRKAQVEAHGGASLEEALIPVVEFSLLQEKITCKIQGAEDDPATVIKEESSRVLPLFCSKTNARLWGRIQGKVYHAMQDEENPALFKLDLEEHNERWRTGKVYEVTLFDDDNELTALRFVLRNPQKGRRPNDGSDFFP